MTSRKNREFYPMGLLPDAFSRVSLFTLTIALLPVGLASIHGTPGECESGTDQARLKCLEQAYDKADRELNSLYQKLRKALPAAVAEDLKQSSLSWIAYKEGLCEQAAGIQNPDSESARLIEIKGCLLAFTTSRIQYLRRAFPLRPIPRKDASGDYDDGLGGSISLSKTNGTLYHFKIQVVRGPTYHTGEIEGDMDRKNGNRAIVKGDSEDEAPCVIRMVQAGRVLTITEGEGCTRYHGARAYFDGTYRLLEPL